MNYRRLDDAGEAFGDRPRRVAHRRQRRPLLEKVQRLAPLVRERGLTMAQLALAWVLRRPEVTSCIIGATRSEQAADNTAASRVKLPAETVGRMEEILS